MTCWAEPLSDCEGKASREHYVSKGVFDTEMVTASGLSWCKGQEVQISLASAVAKILCEKHNSSLSEFDSVAADLSQFLLKEFRNSPKGSAHITVNGWKLEKWALKTAINLTYLGAFGDRSVFPTLEHLEILFRERSVPDGMGLYLVGGTLDLGVASPGVHWIDIRDTETSELVAVKLTLNGLQFLACLVPERADKKTVSDYENAGGANMSLSYRPNKIVLAGNGHAGDKVICLDWEMKR